MTIKRRLFLSNILMILVPVVATALIGFLCVGFIWLAFINGAGLEMHDQEDFERACMAITKTIEHDLEKGKELSALDSLFDGNGMSAKIVSENQNIFSYGAGDPGDDALLAASEKLGDNISITQNGRTLYAQKSAVNGHEYRIYLFGSGYDRSVFDDLETAMAVSAILIFAVIFASILFTNRFLTKFMFKKIEEPLDQLVSGVYQIRDGNLEHQIEYTHKDEFLPVCSAFNEMAVRLKESVALTQQQDISRKELLAGISHDIRSPLTSIQAYVEGLLDGIAKTPETQQRYLKTIKAKAEDLEHIVSQLFLFSKMELPDFPENPEVLHLDEYIAETVRAEKEEYAQKGLLIETDLSSAVIYADPTQVYRIITNILENSLKYKNKEQGKARITLRAEDSVCHLSFADDGPGAAQEKLPHLFEVFYRSDPSRQNPDKGSGLGLAIVKNSVERIGGTVSALSGEYGGLEIRIELPCGVERHEENIDY